MRTSAEIAAEPDPSITSTLVTSEPGGPFAQARIVSSPQLTRPIDRRVSIESL
jgi:hypothetical protein